MIDREAGKRAFRAAQSDNFTDSDWVPMPVEELAAELAQSHPRYSPTALLGKGGMGSVYGAKDHETRRRVAIKVLRPDALCDDAYLHRFEREIVNHRKLQHPNIVPVFDSGKTNEGSRFFVMPLLEGHTLAQLLQVGPHIELGQIASIMLALCQGAAYIHSQGLVHRDFKASNVFLTAEGRVFILDFGIARDFTAGPTTASRLFGTPGTPGHIAPEVRDGSPATPASDIYALGVVFYQMLTGTIPDGWPKDPSRIRGNVALDEIARKALSSLPHERFANATLLAESITHAMKQPDDRKARATSAPPKRPFQEQSPYVAGAVPLPFECVTVKILHDQTTAIVGGLGGKIAAVDLRTGAVMDTVTANDSTPQPAPREIKYVGDTFFFLELAPVRQCFYTMGHSAELKTWTFDGALRLLETVPLLSPHWNQLRAAIAEAKDKKGWSTWTCYSQDLWRGVREGVLEAKLSPDRSSMLCLADWFAVFRCDLAGRLRNEPKVVGDVFAIGPANPSATEFWAGCSSFGFVGLRRIGFESREVLSAKNRGAFDGLQVLSPTILRAGQAAVRLPALSAVESSEFRVSTSPMANRHSAAVLPRTGRVFVPYGYVIEAYDLNTLREDGDPLVAGHEDDVRDLDSTSDESNLVSVDSGTLRVWDLRSRTPVGGYPSRQDFLRVRHNSPTQLQTTDGKVYGSDRDRIAVLDMAKRDVLSARGSLSPVAVAGAAERVHALTVETADGDPYTGLEGLVSKVLKVSPPPAVYLHHHTVDAQGVSDNGRVRFDLLPSHGRPRSLFRSEFVHELSRATTGQDIGHGRIALLIAGHLAIYDTATKAVVCGPIDISRPAEPKEGWPYYTELSVSPDGMRLFAWGNDLSIKVFNTLNLSQQSGIRDTECRIDNLVPWVDSRHVLYTTSSRPSEKRRLQVADSTAGLVIGELSHGIDFLRSIAILPGGSLLAFEDREKVWILDLTTGQRQLEPIASHVGILSIHVSPSQTEIVTVSRDGSARFWNIEARLQNAPPAERVLIRAKASRNESA